MAKLKLVQANEKLAEHKTQNAEVTGKAGRE